MNETRAAALAAFGQAQQQGEKLGIMLCGHGSRSAAAVDEFRAFAEALPQALPQAALEAAGGAAIAVEYGYLEFANPLIRDGLDKLRDAGCTRILAVPGMLLAAMHSKNDIPTVLNTYAAKHSVNISYGRELGVDAKMLAAAADRIQSAVDKANAELGDVSMEETCLAVIGRGASDPDANGNVSKIARMLWEGMGFGWCETGYSGVTFPLVEPCLSHVAKLPYKRVIVFPYFLFSGILIDRIYGFTDQVAAEHPHIQFIKAPYLGNHALVRDTFVERLYEQLGEAPPLTCGTCKYRTQILGFEAEVGAVQESHHHHVEGQGANAPGSNVETCVQCDTFCTGVCRLEDEAAHVHAHGHGHSHDHAHDHVHAQYPHPTHPHGPISALKSKKT
ncbi:MAG: sirohydrochlorin chelatase [Rhodobacteraceae bacterium]|nr:sirohydrochlorin chelatase [Paracoccaceae bacterium]